MRPVQIQVEINIGGRVLEPDREHLSLGQFDREYVVRVGLIVQRNSETRCPQRLPRDVIVERKIGSRHVLYVHRTTRWVEDSRRAHADGNGISSSDRSGARNRECTDRY